MEVAEAEEDEEPPAEAEGEVGAFLCLPVHLDEEAESEHEGEDGICFSGKEEEDGFVDVPVQCGEPRGFAGRVHVEVEMLQSMDDEEAEEGEAAQGVNDLNAVVDRSHGCRLG